MAAPVVRHLVKVDPGNLGAWINLAYSVRRAERIEQAEAILLKACVLHPRLSRLRPAIDLDKDIRRLPLDGDDPNWPGSERVFKYREISRGLPPRAKYPLSHPAWRYGEREPALVMASARDSQLGFSRIYDYFQKRKYYYCMFIINDLYR